MNPENSKLQLRENLMDSLLRSAYPSDLEREQTCIANVLRQIELEKTSVSDDLPPQLAEHTVHRGTGLPNTMDRSKRRRLNGKWIPWAIAASTLAVIGFALQLLDTSGNAMAAVERSLAAAKELEARHYRIEVTTATEPQTFRDSTSDLYVQGIDQFALRHPALIANGEIWLGSDGEESWVVPSIGPIRMGDETGLGKWLTIREQLSSPILHIETVLSRMKRGYQLSHKPDATLLLDDGTSIVCQLVVAKLTTKTLAKAPDKIELWSDKQTGVAIRLRASFSKQTSGRAARQVSLTLVDSPELPDDWFKPTGHYRGFRRTLRFDSIE